MTTIPAYAQLAMITDNLTKVQAKIAFKNWCKETSMSEDDGNELLFQLPEEAAIAILKVHNKETK